MQVFYALHCMTRKKHGVPPQPFAFVAHFHRHVMSHNQRARGMYERMGFRLHREFPVRVVVRL